MNEVKISVIIPVYGVGKYIEQCARSLFNQTLKSNVEFIFVNDCSKDNSIKILQSIISEYDDRKDQIIIVNHEKNKGLASARNTGMSHAKGKYVIHVDSDDFFEKDMLESMYCVAEQADADIVVADYFITYSNREKYGICNIPERKKQLIENLIIGTATDTVGRMNWNKMIKKSLFTNNSINYIDGVNYNEDLVVMVPLCMNAKKIIKIDKAFTHYVQTNTNSYTKKNNIRSIENRFTATKFIADYLDSFDEDYSSAINIKRVMDKANALIFSDGENQKKYLKKFPELSNYNEALNRIPIYWRIPYRIALKGNLKVFNLMRNINLRIKSLIK